VIIDGHKLRITEHAIEQFRQRCRPALDFKAAKGELMALLHDHGRITLERPAWSRSATTRHGTEAWVLIGDSVALPVLGGAAITCLTRGGIPEEERARRKARRIARRGFRRAVKIGNNIGSVRRERKAAARSKQEAWS
jgi:hypothetical protein